MRYSCALALFLVVGLAVCGQGFRLKHKVSSLPTDDQSLAQEVVQQNVDNIDDDDEPGIEEVTVAGRGGRECLSTGAQCSQGRECCSGHCLIGAGFCFAAGGRSSSDDDQSLAQEVVQPANVDIADIVRHDFKNWYVIKDGRTVRENIEGKYVSAKPRNIIWERIGTWNYDKSNTKTGALIKVRLNGSGGALVKTDLALRFQYGGRVKFWAEHPQLHNKGRFLRKIRVIPDNTYVSRDYKLDVRVSEITVGRVGTRSDPVAEVKLKIRTVYGKIGTPFSTWYKRNDEITVQGKGSYSARKLSSERR